jgi:hypothetical protein
MGSRFRRLVTVTLLGQAVLAVPTLAAAAVPGVLTEQGRLFDAAGAPLQGTASFQFAVYATATGGAPLWTETQTIALDAGYFSAELGTVTPFPPGVWNGAVRYLGITVGSDPEQSPRQATQSVPYALVAGDAVGDLHPHTVTVNGTMVIDAGGNWVGPTTGLVGPTGPQGAAGGNGAAGPQGAVGPTGANGAAGPQGPQGAVGPTGANGAAGPQGVAGAAGPQGVAGPAGPQGVAGVAGPQGVAGVAGPTGPQGPASSNATSIQGIPVLAVQPVDGEFLRYDAASGHWLPATIPVLPSCSAGQFAVSLGAGQWGCNGGSVCATGTGDCNNNPNDGCETNLTSSVSSCGACGHACSANNIASPSCALSTCNGACNAGFADCNGNKQTDGCEVNTLTDAGNCGACGQVCAQGQTCSNGACTVGQIKVLISSGFGSSDLQGYLQGWGYQVTTVAGSSLTSTFDYSPYNVVAFLYDSTLASATPVLQRNVAGNLGIVCHRCDSLDPTFDLGSSGFWQSGSFAITDTSHYISQIFSAGAVDLFFTYKSIVNTPSANTRTLGTATGPSLVVHKTYRRVVTPYYGHTAGMPWSTAAANLTRRSYEWAAGAGAQ